MIGMPETIDLCRILRVSLGPLDMGLLQRLQRPSYATSPGLVADFSRMYRRVSVGVMLVASIP